jgi:hypothetical protein
MNDRQRTSITEDNATPFDGDDDWSGFDEPEYCPRCREAESGGGCVCDPVDPEEEA